MCFMTIEEKLNKGEYIHLDTFKVCIHVFLVSVAQYFYAQVDIDLIFDNAMLYNKRDTVFHKTALRLKAAAHNIINPLYDLPTILRGIHKEEEPEASEESTIGNLEAELDTLNLLISDESFKDEMQLILDTDPISSLLRLERPFYKPLSPPPPPKTTKPKKERTEKPKRDYNLERQRRKEAHAIYAAESAALLDAAPGFRGPRATRSSGMPLIKMDLSALAQSTRLPHLTTQAGDKQSQTESSQAVSAEASEWFAEGEEPVTPSVKPRSWRREHLVLPGQGVPNMVESVDGREMFTNFDRGWILPSGSRRYNRVVPEPSRENQPPKKRQRIGEFFPLNSPFQTN